MKIWIVVAFALLIAVVYQAGVNHGQHKINVLITENLEGQYDRNVDIVSAIVKLQEKTK